MINKYTNVLKMPHAISFDITNKCNLRCLHCFNSSGENEVCKDELSDNEVLNFMNSLKDANLYNVCFCGGETLIRKELLIKCIQIIKDSGSHASMVTNGILADEETILQLEKAGIDAIQFSLDGLEVSHNKLRNKDGVYTSVIDAIRIVLNKTKIHLSIAFSPTKFNTEEFLKVHDLLEKLYLESSRPKTKPNDYIEFRVQPLMILGRAKNNHDIIPSNEQYRKLVQNVHQTENEKLSKHIHVSWGDPIDHLVRYKNTAYLLDQLSIHANGDIVVSAYLPLIVGNIKKHSLREYWLNGLNSIWSTNIVQYLVSKMQSIEDMENISNKIGDINMKEDLYLDVIENDLDDLNLIKDIILSLS